MDLRKGMEKLQAFQLLEKERYGVLLMAAAFWRRTARVEIVGDGDDFQMTWDCESLTLEEMQSLFRLDGQLVALGLALINAQALKPRWLRVDSGMHRLEIRRHDARLVPLARPREGLKFHLRLPFRWRILLPRATKPASRLIEEACRGTGREVTINGVPLPASINLGPCQELWLFKGDAGEVPPVEPHAPLRTEPVERRYHAVVAVGERLLTRGITAIAQGVRFAMPDQRVDPFVSVVLLVPEHPTDLACASLIENEELAATLADLNERIDHALLRLVREERASDPLLVAITGRFRHEGRGDWVEVLGALLRRQCNDPDALPETLRQVTTPRPDAEAPFDSPDFQATLGLVLQRLKERRARFLTLEQLNLLVDAVACLHLLRPNAELARRAVDEAVLLLVATGGLNAAATLLYRFGLRDERLGLLLLCLGHASEADPLLVDPFHRALLAFHAGDPSRAAELFEEALPGAEGPARLVLLDHFARAVAGNGDVERAARLVDEALETSTGLDRVARLAFQGSLRQGFYLYPFRPSGFGQEERWQDLRERGLALSNDYDERVARECLALLQAGDNESYARLWRLGIDRLGAAHPMMRALGRALADRYLQAGERQNCLTVGLIPELLALWPRA